MKRVNLDSLLALLVSTSRDATICAVSVFLKAFPFPKRSKGSWGFYADRFRVWLDNDMRTKLPHTVFARGNSKLPFFAFSTLPFFTCPGMGNCEKWCYSVKAWRYPAAFFRQLQNTLLVWFQLETLAASFQALPYGVTVRLYVDGDIDSARTLAFWFRMLISRPDVKAYGYSKSWDLFLAHRGKTFPANYILNISSGSRYDGDAAKRAAMLALPITRGAFEAVQNAVDVRADFKANGKRVFICPGKCGTCITKTTADPTTHACGSRRFQNVTVLIDIH